MALAVLAAPAAAQGVPGTLHVDGVGEPLSVEVSAHRGYPVYPAWILRGLGARVDNTERGLRVAFAGDTLAFDAGSPYFHSGDQTWQLVEPAYREGGVFYLPHQLFAEWLPATYGDRVAWSDGRLSRVAATETVAATAPSPPAEPEGGSEPLGDPATLAPLIIIDPGHGGPDPGAIGPSGLREKDVVLQVGKRLARVLSDRGYEIRMTRTTDTLIGLSDRAPMANEWRGSRPGLFLSIHANKVSDRRVAGFETFFLSDARTEDERRVAEMENSAMAYESPDRVVPTGDLDLIFNSLRNDFYMRASNSLAGIVQDEFGEFHQGRNRGVKQAGFVVLVGASMPAVLIELAFISNPREERQLGSGAFQLELAEGIADAVDEFFSRHGGLWRGASP
ncbi:MAG: N-acetylmuramoyl-L-alanine amidase, partial [Gemmatimonadota bacterium]